MTLQIIFISGGSTLSWLRSRERGWGGGVVAAAIFPIKLIFCVDIHFGPPRSKYTQEVLKFKGQEGSHQRGRVMG